MEVGIGHFVYDFICDRDISVMRGRRCKLTGGKWGDIRLRRRIGSNLDVYNLAVYAELYRNPVAGTPRIINYYEEAGQLTVIEEYISGGGSTGMCIRKDSPICQQRLA